MTAPPMPQTTAPKRKPVVDATQTPACRANTGPGITVYVDNKHCLHIRASVRGPKCSTW